MLIVVFFSSDYSSSYGGRSTQGAGFMNTTAGDAAGPSKAVRFSFTLSYCFVLLN